ncbi:alpha/beta hydrolase [Luteolibacter pohnpeiensis]|uniref:Alpha/beta hydrolase n=1 Tax=Luteolibacter pohnpeiensis TaxID=454153 RepID=A0A934VWP0_9BACT|nr:alpha/beta hydrolase [Luteolibacter pohnpeiensis]MBK1883013.1 alpha/beta hydrolase [Luteolibacter pohnpeiensis]
MSSILQKVAPIGEAREREMLKDSASYIYHQTPDGDVLAHVFLPQQPSEKPAPVVVFFHGGFWDSSMPTQFVPHCLHFASRGAIAVAAETRTASKNGTGAMEAIEDARELIRWLRNNADTLNLDPDRIAVGGSAGGALLALLTAMPKPKNLPPVDGVDCRPQALILFSALVNTSPRGQGSDRFPNAKLAKANSPMSLVRGKLPPMVFFHGKSDRITPFEDVERFCRKLRWRRNKCKLIDFEKSDHSFFNFNVSHTHFELTVRAADDFLVDCGFLEPDQEHHDTFA